MRLIDYAKTKGIGNKLEEGKEYVVEPSSYIDVIDSNKKVYVIELGTVDGFKNVMWEKYQVREYLLDKIVNVVRDGKRHMVTFKKRFLSDKGITVWNIEDIGEV